MYLIFRQLHLSQGLDGLQQFIGFLHDGRFLHYAHLPDFPSTVACPGKTADIDILVLQAAHVVFAEAQVLIRYILCVFITEFTFQLLIAVTDFHLFVIIVWTTDVRIIPQFLDQPVQCLSLLQRLVITGLIHIYPFRHEMAHHLGQVRNGWSHLIPVFGFHLGIGHRTHILIGFVGIARRASTCLQFEVSVRLYLQHTLNRSESNFYGGPQHREVNQPSCHFQHFRRSSSRNIQETRLHALPKEILFDVRPRNQLQVVPRLQRDVLALDLYITVRSVNRDTRKGTDLHIAPRRLDADVTVFGRTADAIHTVIVTERKAALQTPLTFEIQAWKTGTHVENRLTQR